MRQRLACPVLPEPRRGVDAVVTACVGGLADSVPAHQVPSPSCMAVDAMRAGVRP